MPKTWHIKDADPYFYRLGVRRATRGLPFVDEKNPARAYTFSLLFCGAGQSYSGQRLKAVLFQTLMLLVLTGIAFILIFRKELLALLSAYGVPFTRAFLALEAATFCMLCFWIWNAADAYRTTAKARRVPFRGVESTFLQALSSLLVPGWGQFMNGQPRKGILFGAFAVLNTFSLITIAAVLRLWPLLEPIRSRTMVELLFSAALLYAPLIPIIALAGSYDALRVSLDDTKKETVLDRVLLAVMRFRMKGWIHAFRSPARALLVVLVMAGSVVVIRPYVHLPFSYYSDKLVHAQTRLRDKGMTIAPNMIGRVLSHFGDSSEIPPGTPRADTTQ